MWVATCLAPDGITFSWPAERRAKSQPSVRGLKSKIARAEFSCYVRFFGSATFAMERKEGRKSGAFSGVASGIRPLIAASSWFPRLALMSSVAEKNNGGGGRKRHKQTYGGHAGHKLGQHRQSSPEASGAPTTIRKALISVYFAACVADALGKDSCLLVHPLPVFATNARCICCCCNYPSRRTGQTRWFARSLVRFPAGSIIRSERERLARGLRCHMAAQANNAKKTRGAVPASDAQLNFLFSPFQVRELCVLGDPAADGAIVPMMRLATDCSFFPPENVRQGHSFAAYLVRVSDRVELGH